MPLSTGRPVWPTCVGEYTRATAHQLSKEILMKIKSNVRAGKRGSINNTVVSYVPPVSRCAGI
jgi:hypothetical protein